MDSIFLKVSWVLLEVIAVLWWIYWTIATLALLSHTTTRSTNLFAHSHLLSVWEFTLQLILLLIIPSLVHRFANRRISHSDKICRLGANSLSRCRYTSTLDVFMIDVGTWAGWACYISRLHHTFTRTSALASSDRWHSKIGLWDIVRLCWSSVHRLHIGTWILARFSHLLIGVIPAISLCLRLALWSQATSWAFHVLPLSVCCRTWLSLWVQRYVAWRDGLPILPWLYIVDLDVVETIVKITNI